MVVSTVLAAVTAAVSGRPPPSQTRWSLFPGLPRSTGLRPRGPPALGPHTHGVHTRPRPVHPALLAEAVQDLEVEGVEHPGLGPFGEPAPAGHWGAAAKLTGRQQPRHCCIERSPVRLPPLHRSKTTDHGHGRVVRPLLAPFHEGEPPRCWASPAHSGSMQQCRPAHGPTPPIARSPPRRPGRARWTARPVHDAGVQQGHERPSRLTVSARHRPGGSSRWAGETYPACPASGGPLMRLGRPSMRVGAGRWPGRRAAAPRHRRTARHRCRAGSSLARNGTPRRVRRGGPAPERPGTEADAGTCRPPARERPSVLLPLTIAHRRGAVVTAGGQLRYLIAVMRACSRRPPGALLHPRRRVEAARLPV